MSAKLIHQIVHNVYFLYQQKAIIMHVRVTVCGRLVCSREGSVQNREARVIAHDSFHMATSRRHVFALVAGLINQLSNCLSRSVQELSGLSAPVAFISCSYTVPCRKKVIFRY